eukprot:273828-Rhodomonas_salina.3
MERRKQREEKREREGREGRKERERERGGRSNLKHIAHSDAERLVRDLCVVLAGDLLKRFLHPDAGSVAGIALRAHTLTTQAAQPEKITKSLPLEPRLVVVRVVIHQGLRASRVHNEREQSSQHKERRRKRRKKPRERGKREGRRRANVLRHGAWRQKKGGKVSEKLEARNVLRARNCEGSSHLD